MNDHVPTIEEPSDEDYAANILALRNRLQNRADSTRALFELTKENHDKIINGDDANVRVVSIVEKAQGVDKETGLAEDGTVLLTIDEAYNDALDAAHDLVRFDMVGRGGDLYFLEHLEDIDEDDEDDEDEDDEDDGA